jgi:Zeta toxin.
MDDPKGLSEGEQLALAEKLLTRQRESTLQLSFPVATLTGGQPGAGKSAIKGQVVAHAGKSGVVEIDPDEIRPVLPYMNQFIQQGGSKIPDIANTDAGTVAWLMQKQAVKEHRNLLVDGTLRNTAQAVSTAKDLHDAGYRVEFHGMAVHPDLSHARTYLRREAEIADSDTGFGRAVDDSFHHKAVAGYTATVKAFYEGQSVDRMVLYDHAGAIATDVSLKDGQWKVEGRSKMTATKNPVDVLRKAHASADAVTLYATAVAWGEAAKLASSRKPAAADADVLAQHQAEAEAKARLAISVPAPSKSYRGKVVAITDTEVLQAVGGDVISHRKAALIGPHKASLLDVGADIKITYGTHLDQALIQAGSRTHSRSR